MSNPTRINFVSRASLLMAIAGVILILLGVVFARMLISEGAPAPAVLVACAFIWVPAVLYLVAAINIRRNRIWPIVMGLVVSGLHLLFALYIAISLCVVLDRTGEDWVIAVSFVLALGVSFYQLAMVVYLSKSLRVVRERQEEAARGFETITPQRVLPVEQRNRGQSAPQQGTTDER